MLREYSHTKCESLVQIHATLAKIQHLFLRNCFLLAHPVDCISECAINILHGNVQLSAKQKTALRHNKQNLRRLSIKKTSLKKKRQIIQKGGFLGAIIAPILATLGGSLVWSLFCKR